MSAGKILIVDDDKFVANAYRVKLAKEGFEAKVAYDGEEALAALPEFQPQLIILDLVMPVKDGFTFLAEVRADERFKAIPIIVASNLGQKEDYDRAMALGANSFFVKTDLSLEDLVGKVRGMI